MLKYNGINGVNVFGGVYGNKPNGIIPSSQDHQKQSDKWRLGSNSRPPNGVDNCQQHIGDKGDTPREYEATPPVEIKASIDDRNVISDNTF